MSREEENKKWRMWNKIHRKMKKWDPFDRTWVDMMKEDSYNSKRKNKKRGKK